MVRGSATLQTTISSSWEMWLPSSATLGHHQYFVVLQVQRFDDGERQRYFADDDKQQLGDLVAQQRYEGAADIDANLADNIMRKGKRFRWV